MQFGPKDLANEDLRKARENLMKEESLKRRSDLDQLVREKIQKSQGINSAGGEFTCSKCKGTKTTHYSMQTRSSDEPMTVFVCCLNCGKRWKC